MSDQFYRAFEEKFRGPRALIQQRLEVYLPFVSLIQDQDANATMVDLGCGRGEWLELLQKKGMPAVGVDLDAGMLEACKALQLEVYLEDALRYLKSLNQASVAVVTAFHLAEHLPFETLKELVRESLRVLKPGGLLIMETPNPENLIVATKDFYLDPTHQRPLPPELLAFVPEYYGYETVRIIRLQADVSLKNQKLYVRDLLNGSSQDYAVLAQKKTESELRQRFVQFFQKPLGVSADELFALHVHQSREVDQNLKESIERSNLANERSISANERSNLANERSISANERSNLANERSISANERLEKIETHLPSQYQGLVGWLLLQTFKIAEQGLQSKLLAFRQKITRKIIHALLSFIDSKPKLRRACVRFVKSIGLYSFVKRRVPMEFSGLTFPSKIDSKSQYTVKGFSRNAGEIAARLQQKIISKD